MNERICIKCGEALDDEWEPGERCVTCEQLADEERFTRQWIEGWQRYVGTGYEAITRAAADVCTAKEMGVLDALLWMEMSDARAAERLECSRATVAKHRKSAFAKIQARPIIAETKLPTRRETAPRRPSHWW